MQKLIEASKRVDRAHRDHEAAAEQRAEVGTNVRLEVDARSPAARAAVPRRDVTELLEQASAGITGSVGQQATHPVHERRVACNPLISWIENECPVVARAVAIDVAADARCEGCARGEADDRGDIEPGLHEPRRRTDDGVPPLEVARCPGKLVRVAGGRRRPEASSSVAATESATVEERRLIQRSGESVREIPDDVVRRDAVE